MQHFVCGPQMHAHVFAYTESKTTHGRLSALHQYKPAHHGAGLSNIRYSNPCSKRKQFMHFKQGSYTTPSVAASL